jgi:RNA polymerase sigma-70 factor (ECF subfamily)
VLLQERETQRDRERHRERQLRKRYLLGEMSEAKKSYIDFSQAALGYFDVLFSLAKVLTHDQTEAEDLVQETYLRAVRAFDHLVPHSNLKAWLFTIMRNTWLNELRHAPKRSSLIELDGTEEGSVEWLDPVADDPHIVMMRKMELEELGAAFESLPPVYREVVVLRDIEGLSYRQIASILGCPAGTVMSRLGRGRKRLRLLLGWRAEEMNRM